MSQKDKRVVESLNFWEFWVLSRWQNIRIQPPRNQNPFFQSPHLIPWSPPPPPSGITLIAALWWRRAKLETKGEEPARNWPNWKLLTVDCVINKETGRFAPSPFRPRSFRPRSFRPKSKSFRPRSEVVSPQLKVVSPQLKVVSPQLQSCFV